MDDTELKLYTITDALVDSPLTADDMQNAIREALSNGGYIGSQGGVRIVPSGFDVGTQGLIRGGQTDYNTGAGWFLGYSGGAYKLSIGNPAARYITWDGSTLTINGYAVTGKGSFGGDGSDGPLSISAGTTTISCAGALTLTKNYTVISITGTATLAFSNPHNNGTIVTLKSQTGVTISATIDASAMGASGGAAVAASQQIGLAGSRGASNVVATGGAIPGASFGGADIGTGGTSPGFLGLIAGSVVQLAVGAGGGSGNTNTNATGTSGAGGRGGGALYVECNTAWNVTGTITVAGAIGGNGSNGGGANTGAGGGGGGGAGTFVGLYNTLTTDSGTRTVTGGAAGSGGTSTAGGTGGAGGGGGGGAGTAGTNGVATAVDDGGAGGAGGTGISLVTTNLYLP